MAPVINPRAINSTPILTGGEDCARVVTSMLMSLFTAILPLIDHIALEVPFDIKRVITSDLTVSLRHQLGVLIYSSVLLIYSSVLWI
jgi:hypothetical protein